MHKRTWRLFAAAAFSIPFATACGNRDGNAMYDSASGTMAMTDSAEMGGQGTMDEMSHDATIKVSLASFVALVNQAEIEAGQFANANARHADVKQYARLMVDDHRKAMEELGEPGMDNGAGNGVMASIMTQLSQSHQTVMQSLRSATSASFDETYMNSQVAAHRQVLEVLRQHSASVQSSEQRTKMTDMQKNVEAHLRRAQKIVQQMGATS